MGPYGADFDYAAAFEKLDLAAGDVAASGNGTFDPLEGAVDLRFTASLGPEKTAELVGKTKQLRVLVDRQGRLTLPLHIEGAMLSPSIDVDLGKALAAGLDLDEPEESVKGLLKGLLDRKKKKTDDE